ncbi:MAG: HisA/HisF-related TIM barrel protein, partial [Gemmatimonadota bacterium]
GVLSTDVGREGKMEGIERASVARVIEACPHPAWISGGVTTMDELDYLGKQGAAGAVLGMALYTETLDPAMVAPKWGGRATPKDAHDSGTDIRSTDDTGTQENR